MRVEQEHLPEAAAAEPAVSGASLEAFDQPIDDAAPQELPEAHPDVDAGKLSIDGIMKCPHFSRVAEVSPELARTQAEKALQSLQEISALRDSGLDKAAIRSQRIAALRERRQQKTPAAAPAPTVAAKSPKAIEPTPAEQRSAASSLPERPPKQPSREAPRDLETILSLYDIPEPARPADSAEPKEKPAPPAKPTAAIRQSHPAIVTRELTLKPELSQVSQPEPAAAPAEIAPREPAITAEVSRRTESAGQPAPAEVPAMRAEQAVSSAMALAVDTGVSVEAVLPAEATVPVEAQMPTEVEAPTEAFEQTAAVPAPADLSASAETAAVPFAAERAVTAKQETATTPLDMPTVIERLDVLPEADKTSASRTMQEIITVLQTCAAPEDNHDADEPESAEQLKELATVLLEQLDLPQTPNNAAALLAVLRAEISTAPVKSAAELAVDLVHDGTHEAKLQSSKLTGALTGFGQALEQFVQVGKFALQAALLP